MTYDILRPFGPQIYKSNLDSKFVSFMKGIAQNTKKKQIDVSDTLAGNIKQQYRAVMDESEFNTFIMEIKDHIYNAVIAFERKYGIPADTYKSSEEYSFHFGPGGPWINFQGPGEFNPIHSHDGQLSAVYYIDVPPAIAQENNNQVSGPFSNENHRTSAGKIDFVYGTLSYTTEYTYSHQPTTGELFIFPATLSHLVYPFKSNVERISMSFNVFDIDLSKMKI